MSEMYHGDAFLTLGKLVTSWARELKPVTPAELAHTLMQDAANGLLDDHGPVVDGERWGIGWCVPQGDGLGRFGLMRGFDVAQMAVGMGGTQEVAHLILVKKEAALAFAARRHLPPPSWWREAPTNREKPSDEAVYDWLLHYYQGAHDRGDPPPKAENDAFPACSAAIDARHAQMEEAIRRIPRDLKRRQGQRDLPGKSGK